MAWLQPAYLCLGIGAGGRELELELLQWEPSTHRVGRKGPLGVQTDQ